MSPPRDDREAGLPTALSSLYAIFEEKRGAADGHGDSGGEVQDAMVARELQRATAWERRHEAIEREEGELRTSQWKLIRQEIGRFTRDLAVLRYDLESLRSASQKARAQDEGTWLMAEAKIMKELQHLRSELSLERQHRQAGDDAAVAGVVSKIEQVAESCGESCKELQHLRAELSLERHRRLMGDEAAAVDAASKVEEFAEACRERCKDQEDVRGCLAELRAAVDVLQPQLDALHGAVRQEAQKREAGDASMTRNILSHQAALAGELRDCDAAHQQLMQGLKDAIEQEKAGREEASRALAARLDRLEHDAARQLEGPPHLHALRKRVDSMAQAWAVGQSRLEQRIANMSTRLGLESDAHMGFLNDIQQIMTTSQSRMRNIDNEQAEIAKQSCEGLELAFKRQLEKEAVAREAQLGTMQKALESRLDSLQGL